jgi:hypothetical protein
VGWWGAATTPRLRPVAPESLAERGDGGWVEKICVKAKTPLCFVEEKENNVKDTETDNNETYPTQIDVALFTFDTPDS